ncbi:hypothetical protein [Aeromicrobium alkaliterrae]|uniref:DUF1871 family protein n=1 Tax=Aeromicrobium alkaliterrae TaxID=302168 RepID=A0ABP4VPL1_9ACTN
MAHDASWARTAQAQLRVILNEWDPIGVFYPGDPDDLPDALDAYDCMRDPLISSLLKGADRSEVAELLRRELTDHMGIEASQLTDDVLDRIFVWWESVR